MYKDSVWAFKRHWYYIWKLYCEKYIMHHITFWPTFLCKRLFLVYCLLGGFLVESMHVRPFNIYRSAWQNQLLIPLTGASFSSLLVFFSSVEPIILLFVDQIRLAPLLDFHFNVAVHNFQLPFMYPVCRLSRDYHREITGWVHEVAG